MRINQHHIIIPPVSGKISVLQIHEVLFQKRTQRIESGRIKQQNLSGLISDFSVTGIGISGIPVVIEILSMQFRTGKSHERKSENDDCTEKIFYIGPEHIFNIKVKRQR
jgi:hypothetical protein